MRDLFGNIEVIYELHLAFLASLQGAVIAGGSSDLIARCFLNLMAGGALAHFTTYAVGLQAADSLLATNFGGKASSKLTKFMTNPQLLAHSATVCRSARCSSSRFSASASTRCCCPTLCATRPPPTPAYVKLQDASSLLADLVQRVNARKHSAEARDAAQRLAKHVSCDGGSELAAEFEAALDSNSAELLFDAAVESLLPTEGEHEPRTKPVHLYVLNTALLVCEPAGRDTCAAFRCRRAIIAMMKLVAVVTWQSCLVVDVRSVGSHAFVFAVHGDGHVWRMSAATAGLKAQCLEVMHGAHQRRAGRRRRRCRHVGNVALGAWRSHANRFRRAVCQRSLSMCCTPTMTIHRHSRTTYHSCSSDRRHSSHHQAPPRPRRRPFNQCQLHLCLYSLCNNNHHHNNNNHHHNNHHNNNHQLYQNRHHHPNQCHRLQ
jgi:hypothetical protein